MRTGDGSSAHLLGYTTLALAVALAACGGSSTTGGANPIATTGSNVLPISVTQGPSHGSVNTAFTSVTICAPGSTTACQTIDGIEVDTGSSGLRILASAVTVPLPAVTASSGSTVGECFQFMDGVTWGAVHSADVKLAGEQASGVSIQLVGETELAVPDGCTNLGVPSENTLDTLGANGILGVGSFRQDCGVACSLTGSSNPGLYYECSASGCQPTAVTLGQQVPNPVWLFPHDNNGVIVELPSAPLTGGPAIAGSLVFGIGTQSNNGLGGATVFRLDLDGTFSVRYGSQAYSHSFIDTGSNGLYFLDAATTGMPLCPDSKDFYCPTSQQNLSATNLGSNGTTGAVPFGVLNADTIFATGFTVLTGLAGPNTGVFDWGLPFFYGRNVYTAIESQSTPAGLGPYWAY